MRFFSRCIDKLLHVFCARRYNTHMICSLATKKFCMICCAETISARQSHLYAWHQFAAGEDVDVMTCFRWTFSCSCSGCTHGRWNLPTALATIYRITKQKNLKMTNHKCSRRPIAGSAISRVCTTVSLSGRILSTRLSLGAHQEQLQNSVFNLSSWHQRHNKSNTRHSLILSVWIL